MSALAINGAAIAQTRQNNPAAAARPQQAAVVKTRPNMILILSDDNSVPHDGCHADPNVRGLSLTPNLQALAASGMCFDRAYSTAPQCAPSRTSIFAGRNPVDIGVSRFAQPARLEVPYFSDLLRASGYWVGLEGRNHHLAGREDDPPHIKKLLAQTGLSRIGDRFDYVNTFDTKNVDATQIGAIVGRTLDKVPAGKPFFLYFGFNQTHRPFVSDQSDIDTAKLKLPPDWPDLPATREDYARYLSDLRTMDRGVGSLMEMLKSRGLAENTIIVFMGDNGEAMHRGKGTLYERGSHVPLILRWPGHVRPGAHSDALVSGIDLAKTFLEAADIQPDPKMTGLSLLPIARGQSADGHKYVFTERGWHPGGLTVSEGLDYARAITGRRYKLIYNAQPYQPYSPVDQAGRYIVRKSAAGPKEGSGAVAKQKGGDILPARWLSDEERARMPWRAVVRAHLDGNLPPLIERLYFKRPRPIFELYDLEKDQFELNNLAGNPELNAVETELREELDKWMVLSGDYLPLATDAYRETPDPTVTPSPGTAVEGAAAPRRMPH